MNILLVYGTTEGQTRKIAAFLKAELEKTKHTVTLCDATDNPVSPEGYDAILIGASMHIQKYQTSILNYIQNHKKQLNTLHSAFLSVSLTAAADDETSWKELKDITVAFLSDTGWKPGMVEYVAGALRFTEYDFLKKFIMRQIAKKAGRPTDASHDTEYTDWDKLSAFLKAFIEHWTPRPQTVTTVDSDQQAVA